MSSLPSMKKIFLIVMFLTFVLPFIYYQNLAVHRTSDSSSNLENVSRYVVKDRPGRNLTELWTYLTSLVGNDTLYPETLDVPSVLDSLRTARITNASIFEKASSFKWLFHLEGGAKAVFKPELVPGLNEFDKCNHGCERPQSEVAAFAINRMLNLRNMPFTTGRIVSWTDEILPVADERLTSAANGTQGNSTVCFSHSCVGTIGRTIRCFPRGEIVGVMIYFLPFRIDSFAKHFPWYGKRKTMELSTFGNEASCMLLRKGIYRKDRHFAYTTDLAISDYLMGHIDSQHFYIFGSDRTPQMNVVLDAGRAFCPLAQHLSSTLAPVIQCCKIRKRVYESLQKHKEDFVEKFISLTKGDPLFPTRSDQKLTTFKPRVQQILSLIDLCASQTNLATVLMDL